MSDNSSQNLALFAILVVLALVVAIGAYALTPGVEDDCLTQMVVLATPTPATIAPPPASDDANRSPALPPALAQAAFRAAPASASMAPPAVRDDKIQLPSASLSDLANLDAAPEALATASEKARGVGDKQIYSGKIHVAVVERPPAAAAPAEALAPRDRQASPPAARIDAIPRRPPVHSSPILGDAGSTSPAPWRHHRLRRNGPEPGGGGSSGVGLASGAPGGFGAVAGGFGVGPTGGARSSSAAFGSATINAGGSNASSGAGGAQVRLATKRLCPTILAHASSYDDGLVLFCQPIAQM